jgi:hypothetical protein
MDKQYVEVLNGAGGVLTFAEFVSRCRDKNIDARLWLRVKHTGALFTWIENGVHYISTSPQGVAAQTKLGGS